MERGTILARAGCRPDMQGASKCLQMVLTRVANGDIKRKWVHFSFEPDILLLPP